MIVKTGCPIPHTPLMQSFIGFASLYYLNEATALPKALINESSEPVNK